jgi:hypothetical protein
LPKLSRALPARGGLGDTVRMHGTVAETLALAIRARQPVELEYRYEGQGMRTVHPHALYQTARGLICDVYQVSGYTSARRTLPGWRALPVNQIVSAEPKPGRFPLAPGYNPTYGRYRDGITA